VKAGLGRQIPANQQRRGAIRKSQQRSINSAISHQKKRFSPCALVVHKTHQAPQRPRFLPREAHKCVKQTEENGNCISENIKTEVELCRQNHGQ
jgi:hypothetical protein